MGEQLHEGPSIFANSIALRQYGTAGGASLKHLGENKVSFEFMGQKGSGSDGISWQVQCIKTQALIHTRG